MKSFLVIGSLLLFVTSISIGASVFTTNIFANAQETGNSIIASFNATNKDGNVTIGNSIYEGKGEITSQTVVQGPTVETSFSSNDTISKGGGASSETVKEIGTYTSTPRANGVLYGEGKGIITGQNNEIVTGEQRIECHIKTLPFESTLRERKRQRGKDDSSPSS